MKLACPAFDDESDSYSDVTRQTINDDWAEYVAEKSDRVDYSLTYVASSSRELIPVHLVTDNKNQNPITIHAGLILFHFAIHDRLDNNGRPQDWLYPRPGSFFSTSPSIQFPLPLERRTTSSSRKLQPTLVVYSSTN